METEDDSKATKVRARCISLFYSSLANGLASQKHPLIHMCHSWRLFSGAASTALKHCAVGF
jgi:hypothetical protein